MSKPHQLVVSLGDSEIFVEDLETLRDGTRIKDSIIHYYGNLFQNRTNTEKNIVRIIPPCTLIYFKFYLNSYDEYSVKIWNPFAYEFVLLPVISVDSPTDTGKHASLLLWKEKSFYHIDSNGSNDWYARETAQKVSIIFGFDNFSFMNIPSQQQQNGYDCGVFVIAFMDYLCKTKGNLNGIYDAVSQNSVTELRTNIRNELKSKIE